MLVVAGGCFSGASVRRARTAETRGQYETAYELYCQSVRQSPSSFAAADGLQRVTPRAAAAWERKARAAAERQNYELAWRLYMYVLEIRPDHPTAGREVRRLEREHAEAIAASRRAWLKDGTAALVRNLPRYTVSAATEEALAAETPGATSAPAEQPEELVRPITLAPEPAMRHDEIEGLMRPQSLPAAAAAAPPRTEDFLTAVILSRDDPRFPRGANALDGLILRLREAHALPSADVDIYVRKERIARQRAWKPGESATVTGESGRRYEVVLLSVIEPTQTVRVGVRSAE
ncbi:MAG TPA: hypothetical protein VGM03_03065 [Phycisphaerae bacterium]